MANETLGYVATALADTTVAALTEAAAKLRGSDLFVNASPGYVTSTFSTIKDLFRREWVIPCIGTRLAL